MARNFIKLDWDWREDPKAMDFESRHGKAAMVDWVMLMISMQEIPPLEASPGIIDYNDNGQRLKLERNMGKKGKALERFVGWCAECGLVSADEWERFRHIGSSRSVHDAEARARRKEAARVGGEARRRKLGSPGGDGAAIEPHSEPHSESVGRA